jgi:Fe-S-cluster containining protein
MMTGSGSTATAHGATSADEHLLEFESYRGNQGPEEETAELEGLMARAKGNKEPPRDHDGAVADWQQHADQNDDRNYKFLRSLKFRDYGFEPDELAGQLHQQAFQIVDCTRCANCCKTMRVKLTDADIDRIAEHFGMTTDQFARAYLEPEKEEGMQRIREQPCPFLGPDNRCTIYALRPACCREYPHTDKEGFTFRTMLHANNAKQCPAVFWIVERMRKQANR